MIGIEPNECLDETYGWKGRFVSAERLFCYGSLQIAEVIRAVIGRTPESVVAMLPGHEIYRVRDAIYPGVAPKEGGLVPGLLYSDLTDKELARLDIFEGEPYTRKMTSVRLVDGTPIGAWIYRPPAAKRHCLTDERWDLQSFKRDGLEQFMNQCFGECVAR